MKRILIVEDDSLLNKTLAYNLTSDGYKVTSVFNVKPAVYQLSNNEYDLILLDINLPDGSGYEAGAVDYITNPFSIGALQRKISAMFAMLEHHKPAKDIYDDGKVKGWCNTL